MDALSYTGSVEAVLARLDLALDFCADALIAGDGHTAFGSANDVLAAVSQNVDRRLWRDIVRPHVRRHRFAHLTLECPLTRRSFERPRGYPGDAVLLDLIYGHRDAASMTAELTGVARTAQAFTFAVPACAAVRARRVRLAEEIDMTARTRPGARVLSVACGHLRELELSDTFGGGDVEVIGLDQDPRSLDVASSYPGVRTVEESVRGLLKQAGTLTDFDLIYAAGLYDYLDRRTAAALTANLFGRLRAGGRLLVANFLVGVWEAPYLDVFMDWQLMYRDADAIAGFAASLDRDALAQLGVSADPQGYIGYLDVVRR